MVHHGLDYTCTWHLKNLRVLIAVDSDPWHPKYMYGYLKQWYNPNLYELGWCLAFLFGTQHTWYGCGIISNIFAMCAFWAILCQFYCSPPHHTTNMANVPSIVSVSWSYTNMEGIWVVLKPWSKSFFWCCGSLFLNNTFGYGNMICWPKCNVCVLEAKVSMRDHDPCFIPYGYGMDDWVVFLCAPCWF